MSLCCIIKCYTPEELRLPEKEWKEQKVVSYRFVNKSFSQFARYIVTLFEALAPRICLPKFRNKLWLRLVSFLKNKWLSKDSMGWKVKVLLNRGELVSSPALVKRLVNKPVLMTAALRVSGVKLTFIIPIQGMDNNLIYCAFISKAIACLVLSLNHLLNTYYILRSLGIETKDQTLLVKWFTI